MIARCRSTFAKITCLICSITLYSLVNMFYFASIRVDQTWKIIELNRQNRFISHSPEIINNSKAIELNQQNRFISHSPEIINYSKTIDQYLSVNGVNIHTPAEYVKVEMNEPVILVMTACARWTKLQQSIESIELYNTYPHMLAKYVLDDCQDIDGFYAMKAKYGLNTSYGYHFINGYLNPNISLLRRAGNKVDEHRGFRSHSVIRLFLKHIYSGNRTLSQAKYLFLTENDWVFYEHGFIEDSFAVLYGSAKWQHSVSMYTLRNTQMDSNEFSGYPQHTRHNLCGGETYRVKGGKPIYVANVLGYNDRLISYWIANDDTSDCWGGYSHNPHLQSIEQLLEKERTENVSIDKYDANTIYGEFEMSCFVKEAGYVQAYPIYNGYAKHIGKLQHTQQRFRKRRFLGKKQWTYSEKCTIH